MTDSPPRWQEYLPLADLAGRMDPRNPKDHADDDLSASLVRFAYTEPVTLDERTGRLVAGHGRIGALQRAQQKGPPKGYKGPWPPEGIITDDDGNWLVPASRGWRSESDEEAAAYLVASNQLTIKGGWHPDVLGPLLAEVNAASDLDGLGIDIPDLESLIGEYGHEENLDRLLRELSGQPEPEEARTDPDAVPEPPVPCTQRGDLWLLDQHRLLCGDATDATDVARLTGGKRAQLMMTDPPYGVSYDAEWRGKAMPDNAFAPNRSGKVTNDDQDDWEPAYRLAPVDVAYVWHAAQSTDVVMAGLRAAELEPRQQIIWRKLSWPISRSAYHWQHEPCCYAVRRGAKANWRGDRTQTTVWDAASPNQVYGSSTDDKTPHPTQKPIVLYERATLNHTRPGDVIYDPFAGSGSAVIAAYRTGRVAWMLDLDPAYCDLICRRFQEHTGVVPVLEATGASHDFTADA